MSEDRPQRRAWRLRKEGGWSPAEKRRLLTRLALAVLAFLLLVIVPGYFASRPAFLQRYPRLETPYETWSGSVHAKVPCRQCHVPPGRAQLAYGARMLGEFYLSFVMPGRQPDLFGKPTDASCSRCHMDLRTVSPKGDLNIPHRAHVSVLKLKCVDCHRYLVHEASPEGKHVPRMQDCLRCHDGRTAKNQCSACHTDKVEPLTHREATWLVQHPKRAESGECNRCHKWTKDWCADCHAKRPRSHTTAWRSTHRERVEQRRNCEACHKGDFCVRCHGEVPQLNFDPALKLVQ